MVDAARGLFRAKAWPEPRLRAALLGAARVAQPRRAGRWAADVPDSPLGARRVQHPSVRRCRVGDAIRGGALVDAAESASPARARAARGACSVSVQKIADGHWVARWLVAGRQPQVTCRHRSDRQAERMARAAETQLREQAEMGGYATGKPSRMTFGDWLVQWAKTEGPFWAASVRQKRLQRMAVWVEPILASVPLDQLTEPQLRAWHADVSAHAAEKGSGATQVAHAWRDVSAALGAAHRDGLIPRNPA